MIGQHVRTPPHLWPLFSHMIDLCPLGEERTPEYWDEWFKVSAPVPELSLPLYWNGDYSRFKPWVPYLIKWHKEGHYVCGLIPMGDNEEIRALTDYGIKFFLPNQRIFPEVRSVNLVILTG